MLNASSTTVTCSVVDIDQPTIRRLKTSSTTQIQEAHPRRDIRDISYPQHIRRIRRERTVDQIGRLPPAGAHRRHHELAPADADNVRLTHHPRDAVPAGRNAFRSKLGMNAWRTVGCA